MARTTSSCCRLRVALCAGIAAMALGLADAFGTSVVYGPASAELVLLTSKLAAKEGQESFAICGPGQESKSNRLMYGTKREDGEDEDKEVEEDSDTVVAKPISSGDDMQDALSKASTLFLVCYNNPIEEAALNTLINTSGSDLSKVVMLSKMGATAGGGGFFGGGSKLADSEKAVRKICDSKNLELSIVRAGTLKGGGPGEYPALDLGLSQSYYNNLFELSEATCTMSHDRFTLGVDCTKGDTVQMPNAFTAMGTKTSFDAYPYDTNRINAAMACIMAAKYDKPVDFSVGAAKATELPSKEEWEEILVKMEV